MWVRRLVAAAAVLALAVVVVLVTGGWPDQGRRSSPLGHANPLVRTRWVPLGELGVGGRLTGLAVDPADPNVMLAGGDMLGVGRSVDGGRTWEAATGFSSWEINAFTWDASNPGVVWVGTMSGPYESTDAGRTWLSRRVGMPTGDYPYSAPVQKVMEDVTNHDHLLAFGGNQRQFSTPGTGAVHYGLVYESIDGGAHWSTIANIGTNWNITDVVAGSGDLRTLYAAVLDHGVYKSTDGGHSWVVMNGGLPNAEVMALATDPAEPGVVWAALSHDASPTGGIYRPGGIYKTTDGGQSWVSDNTGIPQIAGSATVATAMDSVYRAGDGTLYTADEGSADQNRYESTDGGAHWTRAGGSFPKADPASATPFVWASSTNGDHVIGGSSDTLMASTDRGASWYDAGSTRVATGGWRGNGFSGLLGTRVAFDKSQPRDIFLTAFDSGNLLRSANAGVSWTRPLSGWDNYGGGYDVQTGGAAGKVVYEVLGQAGAFNGLGVSTDSGQTWSVHVGGALPERYTVGSGQGSIAIASSNGATAYAVLPDKQLYLTTDTGTSWTHVSLPSPAYAVASSTDFRTIYVATDAGVERIATRGQPQLLSSSPTSLHRLVVSSGGTVYGVGPLSDVARAGLWTNQTGSWTRLASNAQVNDVAIDPRNPRHIVYVTNDNPYHTTSLATGVWVSCDAGHEFSQYNPGLPVLRVLSVGFTLDPRTRGHRHRRPRILADAIAEMQRAGEPECDLSDRRRARSRRLQARSPGAGPGRGVGGGGGHREESPAVLHALEPSDSNVCTVGAAGLDVQRTPQIASDAENQTWGRRRLRWRLEPGLHGDDHGGDLRGTQAHPTGVGPEVEVMAGHRLDRRAGGLGCIACGHGGAVVILSERCALHLGGELDAPPAGRPLRQRPGLQVTERNRLPTVNRCPGALVELTPGRERPIAAR